MEIITDFAVQYSQWVRFLHIAGVVIALGAVMSSDLLLAWFKLKPGLGRTMARMAPIFSLQVWIGLTLISLSGFLLFLPMQGIEYSRVFQFKMFLVLVIFLNGIFLNVWVTPRFQELLPEWEQSTKRVRTFTVIAGISAALSFFSWWGAVILMKVL